MIVQAEIDENGVLKMSDPKLWGKKVELSLFDSENPDLEKETDWNAIKSIVHKANELDFPRCSHEEIIRDLHDLRG